METNSNSGKRKTAAVNANGADNRQTRQKGYESDSTAQTKRMQFYHSIKYPGARLNKPHIHIYCTHVVFENTLTIAAMVFV